MIEIVAKDYPHFYNILREYKIHEEKAIFVPWESVKLKEKISGAFPIYETNVKRDGSDWIDYSSFG